MTSRERVRKAVLFQEPDRIPIDLPEQYGSDFLYVGADPDPGWHPTLNSETKWEDEWDCIWEKLPGDKTMGQVRFHPLSDYANLKNYHFPEYKNPKRYESAGKDISSNKDEKFVLAGIPLSFIHRLEYLRGHQEAWTDSYINPGELCELLDRLSDIAIDSIKNFARLGVDGIFSADDWGLQDRPMVAPEVFREFFKPRYKKVYHFAHEHGILAFLHSCGYIIDLLDDFIDAELNVIQMDQQENMGVDRLSKLFGGRLCFWCPVDIQNVMVRGTVEDVRNYAENLVKSLGKFNGGFIAKWYPSPEAVGHSQEKIDAMSRAFIEHGKLIFPTP